MNRNLLYCLLAIYFLMVFLYSLNSGLTCSNDGSHFALVNTMVEHGSFELEENVRFAKITENAYSLQNYIPPNHNEIELGIDNRGNDFPLWLINGKRITFP